MYDYDKILKESLDRLFGEDFDKVGEKKDLKLGHTLLNVPVIKQEKKSNKVIYNKNNFKERKEFFSFILLIMFFLVLFISAYPTISDDIFYKDKAQVIKEEKIEYICDVISQGELKTTGIGTCIINGNDILMKSSFKTLDDSINYMLIITNSNSRPVTIKKYKSINQSEQMNVTYKMFYNNKEITSDNQVIREKITLKSKESLIVIVNQKYNEEYPLNLKELEYNINIGF